MNNRLKHEDYQLLLKNRFSDPKIKFVCADFKPLSENAEGFMGDHFKLNLTYKREEIEHTENFFVKAVPLNVPEGHPIKADNIYEKEIFVYDFLFREFAKIGYDTSFSPKCYLCVRGDTLVMQDMMELEFRLPERQSFYGVTEVKSLLKSLALLHAAGFAYEKTKTKELGRPFLIGEEFPEATREIFFTQYTTKKGFGCDWFKASLNTLCKLIDMLPKDEEFKSKFKSLLQKAEFGKIFVEDHNLKKVCVHGDLWSNNMMFNYSNDNDVKCCLVDYQLVRYFYPAFDVLLATHFKTNANFKKNHLEEMYQYYYDTLQEILSSYDCEIAEFLPLGDFLRSLKICKSDALFQVASVNSMVFVSAEKLTEFTKANRLITQKDEVSTEERMKEQFKKFCPYVFETDEIYREALTGNLLDLYNALEETYCKIH